MEKPSDHVRRLAGRIDAEADAARGEEPSVDDAAAQIDRQMTANWLRSIDGDALLQSGALTHDQAQAIAHAADLLADAAEPRSA